MERYQLLEKLGSGSFGTVSRAIYKETGQQYAIKCMKATFSDWPEVTQQRELQALIALCQWCDKLVRVYEVVRESNSKLYFVCELMPNGDLKDLIVKHRRDRRKIESALIRSILHQTLEGLRHIHAKGFMHRDLKPENLLMSGNICKVADFSLARIASLGDGDQEGRMTTYVSSRWYRAPELVLEAPKYTTAIDVFALGCIMAELVSLQPLFPGKSEHDQLHVILNLLGPLRNQDWPEGTRLLERLQFNLPPKAQPKDESKSVALRLSKKLGLSDSNAISLLESTLKLDPDKRPTVLDALSHDYIRATQEGTAAMRDCPADAASFKAEQAENTFVETTPVKSSIDPAMMSGPCPHRRAPFVSISPTSRAFVGSGSSKALRTRSGFHDRHSNIYPTVASSKRVWLSPMPSKTPHLVHSSDSKRLRSEYRPCHAFDID